MQTKESTESQYSVHLICFEILNSAKLLKVLRKYDGFDEAGRPNTTPGQACDVTVTL